MTHPKGKAVNNLAIFTPAHTSRYTPHNQQVTVPSLHMDTGTHHKPRTRDHIYFTALKINISPLSV